jgi:hypothetical protein
VPEGHSLVLDAVLDAENGYSRRSDRQRAQRGRRVLGLHGEQHDVRSVHSIRRMIDDGRFQFDESKR